LVFSVVNIVNRNDLFVFSHVDLLLG
jgi:hypothetical protein